MTLDPKKPAKKKIVYACSRPCADDAYSIGVLIDGMKTLALTNDVADGGAGSTQIHAPTWYEV